MRKPQLSITAEILSFIEKSKISLELISITLITTNHMTAHQNATCQFTFPTFTSFYKKPFPMQPNPQYTTKPYYWADCQSNHGQSLKEEVQLLYFFGGWKVMCLSIIFGQVQFYMIGCIWRFQNLFIMETIMDMELKISQYLREPQLYPRPPGDEDPLFAYLIAYIGELFIQGYRIIEKYDSILLFSLMQFQFSDTYKTKNFRTLNKFPPRFKLLLWQISSKHINEDGKIRRHFFNQLISIGELLGETQFHIVYLKQRAYSIVPLNMLERNSIPSCFPYFTKNNWIQPKNGCRPISEKQEGTEMHRLVECFIKGAGEARNPELIRRIQRQKKYNYDLFKVINTVSYIVGKEILENGYQTISVQKWMRKYTEKKFKRYDLLMRGEHKCSIIDWKFSRLDAEQKIKGAGTSRKNELYCQLAKKDFKTEIQLLFYCIHERDVNEAYHCFTIAKFNYQIQTVDIEESEKKEKKQKKNKKYKDFKYIDISDSLCDMVPDVPGEQPLKTSSVKSEPRMLEINKKTLQQLAESKKLPTFAQQTSPRRQKPKPLAQQVYFKQEKSIYIVQQASIKKEKVNPFAQQANSRREKPSSIVQQLIAKQEKFHYIPQQASIKREKQIFKVIQVIQDDNTSNSRKISKIERPSESFQRQESQLAAWNVGGVFTNKEKLKVEKRNAKRKNNLIQCIEYEIQEISD